MFMISVSVFFAFQERPYMCPYCQKTFKTNTNCKKHMKTHKHELAMAAVRAAGSNLQGDNQQALLTTSLYGQQSATTTSLSDSEVVVSELTGINSVFQEGDFPLSADLQHTAQHQQVQQHNLTATQVCNNFDLYGWATNTIVCLL